MIKARQQTSDSSKLLSQRNLDAPPQPLLPPAHDKHEAQPQLLLPILIMQASAPTQHNLLPTPVQNPGRSPAAACLAANTPCSLALDLY